MPVGTSEDSAFHFHDSTSSSSSASALTNYKYESELSENEISNSEDFKRNIIRWEKSVYSAGHDNLNQPSDPQNCKIVDENKQSIIDAKELKPLRYRLRHENLDLEISDASSSITIRFINETNGSDCESNFKFRDVVDKSISSSTSTVCSTDQPIVLPVTELRSEESEFADINIEEKGLEMSVRPETSDVISVNNSQSKNCESRSFSEIPESKCLLSKTQIETPENEQSTSKNLFPKDDLFHRKNENYTKLEFEEVSPSVITEDLKDSVEVEYHLPEKQEAKQKVNGSSSPLVEAKVCPVESSYCSPDNQYTKSGADDNATDLIKEFNSVEGENNKSPSSVTNEPNENCYEENDIHSSRSCDENSQVEKELTENESHAKSMSIPDSVEEKSNDFVFETENVTLRYEPGAPTDSVDVKFRRQANQTKLTFKSTQKKLYVKMIP